ncbi:MAG TPA: FeoB small GTPase domain-containing protein, partial [Saprospiraceae bacterium]|nr:FeoB small GTPase domain-containing protein [Saprospiraceae bacterium]
VLCLNLMDEARRHHIEIDERSLSRELGIPVVLAEARQKVGMDRLIATIEEVASGKYVCKPHRVRTRSPKLSHAIEQLTNKLSEQFPGLPNLNWVALRLLEGDQSIIDAMQSGELGKLGAGLITAQP